MTYVYSTVISILTILFISSSSFSQNGIQFDGVNDIIATNYSGISGSAPRTVEAWIKTTANCNPSAGGTQDVILDWGSSSTGGRFTFCILWANAIRLEVAGNGLSGVTPINDGLWHHVAATYNPMATPSVKLYVDGVLDAEGNLTVAVNTGTSVNVNIGKRVDNINHFEGSMDEVRIWNTAKTITEINQNMNNEICSVDPSLKLNYRMNQGVANGTNTGLTSLTDYSGNGNTGTLTGFALSGTGSNYTTGQTLTSGLTMSTQTASNCFDYTWPLSGATYTSSGTYSHVIPNGNSNNCDSIVTLQLTINTANDLTTNMVECDSYTWPVNGMTYTSSTSVTETLTSSQGCPYDHTLNLTLGTTTTETETRTECGNYTWPVNGMSYTTTGVYTETLTGAFGCDSVLNLDLTINTVDVSTTSNGDGSYSANLGSALYQWVDCDNNYQAITNENNQDFTPSSNGNYAVIVTDNGCSDTSACIMVADVNVDELLASTIEMIPNPSNGSFKINGLNKFETETIAITSNIGQQVEYNQTTKNGEQYFTIDAPTGVYFVQIQLATGSVITKKLIIR